MGKIKIGQIGIGHNHASGNMAAMRKLSDIYDVVGVVEADLDWKAKRGGLACYDGLTWMTEEELFSVPGLEAVAVETDGFDLAPTAYRCAERGVHIHMDKPGGESLADFRELLRLCEQRGLAIQLAYAYRYNPAIRFAIQAVNAGWLGDVFDVDAVMNRYDGDNDDYRQWLSRFQGGAMYIFAGYLIDIVITLLGRPEKITPFLKKTRTDGLIDNGLAVMEYERATAAVKVSVEEVDGMKHRRLTIRGTRGTVDICPIEQPAEHYAARPLTARLTLKHDVPGYAAGTHVVNCGVMADRYTPQLIEFAEIIKGQKPNPFNYDHELLVQESLLLASGCDIDTSFLGILH